MSPSWDYDFIKNAPYTVLIVIGVNVFLIFLIYMIANSKLLKSVKPITNGIQALPSGEPVYVREKGLLSDLAAKINQTSDILQKQKRNLQRKETARANWISGVSHDIRTPLSMVMGYAGQIEDNESLPESERKKARILAMVVLNFEHSAPCQHNGIDKEYTKNATIICKNIEKASQ